MVTVKVKGNTRMNTYKEFLELCDDSGAYIKYTPMIPMHHETLRYILKDALRYLMIRQGNEVKDNGYGVWYKGRFPNGYEVDKLLDLAIEDENKTMQKISASGVDKETAKE